MRFILLSLVIANTCWAFELTCKVINHEVIQGEAKYAVHAQTKKIKISLKSEASAFEQQIGCLTESLKTPHLSMVSFGADKPRDITFCETQNFLNFDKKTISYSNFNDHDVPEEVLDLFKVGNIYYGKLLSNWDTKESLELECE